MAETTVAATPAIRWAACGVHSPPSEACNRCKTAAELTAWWKHDQGRCLPQFCRHCLREAGSFS